MGGWLSFTTDLSWTCSVADTSWEPPLCVCFPVRGYCERSLVSLPVTHSEDAARSFREFWMSPAERQNRISAVMPLTLYLVISAMPSQSWLLHPVTFRQVPGTAYTSSFDTIIRALQQCSEDGVSETKDRCSRQWEGDVGTPPTSSILVGMSELIDGPKIAWGGHFKRSYY